MLGVPLWVLLEQWKPRPNDVVEEEWFTVNPSTNSLFDSLDIPFRHVEGKPNTRQYQFSHSTITAWCRLFVDVLKEVKELATACDMRPMSITELNGRFITLKFVLYENKAFETLLAIPSLQGNIHSTMLTAQRKKRQELSCEYLQREIFLLTVDFESSRQVTHCLFIG
jgi:hypothetical protein